MRQNIWKFVEDSILPVSLFAPMPVGHNKANEVQIPQFHANVPNWPQKFDSSNVLVVVDDRRQIDVKIHFWTQHRAEIIDLTN